MLLTHRKLLQSKAIAIENDLRGTFAQLRSQGGRGGQGEVDARITELVEGLPDLTVLVEPLLIVRRVLREQLGNLHRRLLAIVRDDAPRGEKGNRGPSPSARRDHAPHMDGTEFRWTREVAAG